MSIMLGSLTYEQVYKTYYEQIYNFVCKTVFDAERAKDLTQEVFLRVLKNAHKYKEENKITTWLYRIAYNLCITDYKKRKCEEKCIKLLTHLDQPEISGSNTEVLLLERLMSELPEERSEPLCMYIYDGMSYDEIAVVSGVPIGTVKSRIFRAREEIKHKYEKITNRAC